MKKVSILEFTKRQKVTNLKDTELSKLRGGEDTFGSMMKKLFESMWDEVEKEEAKKKWTYRDGMNAGSNGVER